MKNHHLFAVNAEGIDSEKVKGDFEIYFFRRLKPAAIQNINFMDRQLTAIKITLIWRIGTK